MTSAVVLIGVGNRWRADDGIGLVVVEEVARHLDARVDVVMCDGEPSRLIDAWARRSLAVVVDATHGTGEAGTINMWDGDVPGGSHRSTGSHALGVGNAIALGAALERLPARLVVVGIEAGVTDHGNTLCPAVAAAVSPAVATVLRIVCSS